jgi:hypothetical protein
MTSAAMNQEAPAATAVLAAWSAGGPNQLSFFCKRAGGTLAPLGGEPAAQRLQRTVGHVEISPARTDGEVWLVCPVVV